MIIRVHDPRAPQLAAFAGIPAYAPVERWVVTGRFEPFDAPRTVTTGAVVEGLEHHHTAVGTVRFELAGVPQSLDRLRRGRARAVASCSATRRAA